MQETSPSICVCHKAQCVNNPQSTCLTICGVCTAVGPTSSLYSARHPGQAPLPGANLLVEHVDTEKAAIAALVVLQAASAARTETLRVNRVAAIDACDFGAAKNLNSEISAEAERMRAALEKQPVPWPLARVKSRSKFFGFTSLRLRLLLLLPPPLPTSNSWSKSLRLRWGGTPLRSKDLAAL